jgi:hypothetical protein
MWALQQKYAISGVEVKTRILRLHGVWKNLAYIYPGRVTEWVGGKK